jgi:hypothetical protein
VPFGLWIGDCDELTHSQRLVRLVAYNSAKCMKEIQVMNHSTHLSSLITSTAYIVQWLKNFVKFVAPTLSFRLSGGLSLNDFEPLQFIGKGKLQRGV